jgi:hypothetical protein
LQTAAQGEAQSADIEPALTEHACWPRYPVRGGVALGSSLPRSLPYCRLQSGAGPHVPPAGGKARRHHANPVACPALPSTMKWGIYLNILAYLRI